MDLLPKPKERSFQDGAYTPGIHAMILLAPGTAPGALLYARMLQQTFADQAGLTPDIGRGAAQIILTLVVGALTCGASTVAVLIWSFVEGVLLLSGNSYLCDANGVVLRD